MPHIHYLIDFTVETFIVHGNKVLLRKHDKYKIWLSIGGHIEPYEDPNEAAVREAREETGLTIELDDSLLPNRQADDTRDLIPPYYLNRHRVNATHEHVMLVYFARAKSEKIVEGVEREKSEAWYWFTQAEIEKNPEIKPNVRFYALLALKKLGS